MSNYQYPITNKNTILDGFQCMIEKNKTIGKWYQSKKYFVDAALDVLFDQVGDNESQLYQHDVADDSLNVLLTIGPEYETTDKLLRFHIDALPNLTFSFNDTHGVEFMGYKVNLVSLDNNIKLYPVNPVKLSPLTIHHNEHAPYYVLNGEEFYYLFGNPISKEEWEHRTSSPENLGKF